MSEETVQKEEHLEGLRGTFHRLLVAEKKQFPLLFWSLLVGTLAGLLGGVFRLALERLSFWRDALYHWAHGHEVLTWLLPILVTAILLTISLYLVRRFAPETSGSGVQEMEGALDGVRPVRWRRVLPVKFFSGLFSLGGGMVLGREGPTIQMGGSVGAMIGDWFRVKKLERHCLIAAGAGAGLAAAFNAPLAGILFVIEEMRPQFKYNFLSFQGVMIACAMADIMVRLLTGQAPVIAMPDFDSPNLSSLWIFVVFGSIFGIFGFLFNHFLVKTLNWISGWKGWWHRLTGLLVGAVIGVVGWYLPGAIGGGYEVIPEAVKLQFITGMLFLLFVVRFGTTILSYGSGAPGGIFAPMLALGTLFGIGFGNLVMEGIPHLIQHPGVFAIAGMGALFSATVRAPLTGIALAIEMTGNYSQILPLILTCMSASLVAQGLGGKPIYSVLLHRTLDLQNRAAIKEDRPPA